VRDATGHALGGCDGGCADGWGGGGGGGGGDRGGGGSCGCGVGRLRGGVAEWWDGCGGGGSEAASASAGSAVGGHERARTRGGTPTESIGLCIYWECTAVLSKIPHSNCCKTVPNRPLRHLRGRFGTLLEQLECGIFERTAVRNHGECDQSRGPLTAAILMCSSETSWTQD